MEKELKVIKTGNSYRLENNANQVVKISDIIGEALSAISELGEGIHVNKVIKNIEVKKNTLIFKYTDNTWPQAAFDLTGFDIINY